MALADFWDHKIRVWRGTSARGSHGEEVVTYAALSTPAEVNAAVNRPTAPLGDKGPGLAPIGERRVYMAADADVQAGDVLELLEGPDAAATPTLLVDEPPTRPRDHHSEIRCQVWSGELP